MNPISFGYKCKWIAVRGQCSGMVTAILPILHAKVTDWSEGIRAAYDGEVFVSPPIGNWILVVSVALPDFCNYQHADTLTSWIEVVSRNLDTTVQWFTTHRTSEYHAWCWAEKGKVVRAYGWAGDSGTTVIDSGKRTAEEGELGHRFFDERSSEAKQDPDYWSRKDLSFPNEEYVMQLAGKWSVNPSTLEERFPEIGPGWLGTF